MVHFPSNTPPKIGHRNFLAPHASLLHLHQIIEPIFTPARHGDLETVLAFIRDYYKFDGIPFHSAEIRSSLDRLLKDPALGRVWTVYGEGKMVGYAVLTFGYDLEFGGQVATVTELYLAPEYRRSGIGRRFMRFLEHTCRDLGISALELQVERDNMEAQAFYRALGFISHDRIPLSRRLGHTTTQK